MVISSGLEGRIVRTVGITLGWGGYNDTSGSPLNKLAISADIIEDALFGDGCLCLNEGVEIRLPLMDREGRMRDSASNGIEGKKKVVPHDGGDFQETRNDCSCLLAASFAVRISGLFIARPRRDVDNSVNRSATGCMTLTNRQRADQSEITETRSSFPQAKGPIMKQIRY